MTGIAFGWMGATMALASRGQEAEQVMLTLDRVGLGAAGAAPGRPDPRERQQRPTLVARTFYYRPAALALFQSFKLASLMARS
jgi:hypothetical protein